MINLCLSIYYKFYNSFEANTAHFTILAAKNHAAGEGISTFLCCRVDVRLCSEPSQSCGELRGGVCKAATLCASPSLPGSRCISPAPLSLLAGQLWPKLIIASNLVVWLLESAIPIYVRISYVQVRQMRFSLSCHSLGHDSSHGIRNLPRRCWCSGRHCSVVDDRGPTRESGLRRGSRRVVGTRLARWRFVVILCCDKRARRWYLLSCALVSFELLMTGKHLVSRFQILLLALFRYHPVAMDAACGM